MAGHRIAPAERRPEAFNEAIRALATGRSDAKGTVTLRENQTTTTVTDQTIGDESQPFLTPRTASAATAVGAGVVYISSVVRGSFVITHNSDPALDRTFGWGVVG